ncbi:MAG: CPBP family intramembrane metalloprotease [Bacteroidales bacterium]|nr:CPBP family intramembrane metalloprotease [Candidatus Latescibacterota bacterium]
MFMTPEEHQPKRPIEDPEPGASVFDSLNNYTLLLFAFSCYLMYTSLSMIIFNMEFYATALSIPALIGLIFPLGILAGRFGGGYIRDFDFTIPTLKTAMLVLLISAGSIVPIDAVTYLFERGRPVSENYIEFLVSIKPKGIWPLLALGVGTVVISPLGEEMLFRGLIQKVFHRNMDARLAVVLAGIVFACAHFDIRMIPGITLMGIMMGYIYYRSRNILYPFLSHALFNLISLVRLNATSVESIRQGTHPAPSVIWLLGSLALAATAIACFETAARRVKKMRADNGPAS